MIYLDNAATSWPKPEPVYQAMDKFLREKGGNPGHGSHSLAAAAKQVIDETRLLTSRFINSPCMERMIFTLNCTHSLNLGLKGLLKPGDHVITSCLEHNAVMRPLSNLEKRGIRITRVPVSAQLGTTAVRDIEAAIIPATRMIVMIHASNVNGAVQPVAEYGALARKHNLILMVDAAQSAGHIPLDVQGANIDLLAFSAHKGPLGPPGVGVLYIGPRVDPDTLIEGGTGSESESEIQPGRLPDRYESGTLNSAGIAGLGAGLRYIRDEGPSRIMAFEENLIRRLIEGLSEISGVVIYKAEDLNQQTPVISFNIQGYEPGEVGAILDQAFDIKARTGLQCSPQAHRSLGTFPRGAVRLSPGYFNTCQDIEQAIEAVRRIAKSKTKQV
jgi:cysteine desulfurase family protein